MFIEIDYSKVSKYKQNICGDSFMMKKIPEEGRVVSVLSDGLGSGTKANVLSTLTASMALRYISKEADIVSSSDTIMRTLPVCSERKISYSTLAIVDVDSSGNSTIVEYDTPEFIYLKGSTVVEIEKEVINSVKKIRGDEKLLISKFVVEEGDRIVFFSDGVTQAGLGSLGYPLGWGEKNIKLFISSVIKENPLISSRKLSRLITNRAKLLDNYKCGDDTTCGVYTMREPIVSLLISGAPVNKKDDVEYKNHLENFKGKIVVSGGTTAGIVARELGCDIELSSPDYKSKIPPEMKIKGIDLVSEGIITLKSVLKILEANCRESNCQENRVETVADKIVELFLESDIIKMVIGTAINEANFNSNQDLELRKNIVVKIASILEEKYIKKCELSFY